MLDVTDISPKTHPDDSWAPAVPHLPSNQPLRVASGLPVWVEVAEPEFASAPGLTTSD